MDSSACFAEFDFCPILLRRESARVGRILLPRFENRLISRPFGNFAETKSLKSGKSFWRGTKREDEAKTK